MAYISLSNVSEDITHTKPKFFAEIIAKSQYTTDA